MTIVQLEYLLAVANHGSFSLAAEYCFVTQPSLSMQVKMLEDELGVTLLDRTKKPVIPTEIGEVVLHEARETLKAYHHIKEAIAERKDAMTGKLRLGVIPTIAPYLLHRFIPDFMEAYPRVELEVTEMLTGEIVDALRRDRLDAALVSSGTCGEGIREHELFDDRFCLYVSPHHPLSERSHARIEDIDPNKLVLPAPGHCLREQVLEMCQIPRWQVQGGFEGTSLEAIMRWVDCTDSMTVLPEMAADAIPAERRGQLKPLAKGTMSRKVAMAVRRSYVKEGIIAALTEQIKSLSLPPL